MERRIVIGVTISLAVIMLAAMSTTLYLVCKPPPLLTSVKIKSTSDCNVFYKVVNLQRRNDRRRLMETEFANAAIENYNFVTAVDGKNLTLTPLLKQTFARNDFDWRKGVIGCALSHYAVWNALIKDADHDYYIVLEDDVKLCPGFAGKVQEVVAAAQTYDVIFLSYILPDSKTRVLDGPTVTVRPLDKTAYMGGTQTYYVSKRGAAAMVFHWNTNGIERAIDAEMVFNMTALKFGECAPFLTTTDFADSDLRA